LPSQDSGNACQIIEKKKDLPNIPIAAVLVKKERKTFQWVKTGVFSLL